MNVEALFKLAENQFGLINVSQLNLHLTKAQQTTLRSRNQIVQHAPNVYRIVGTPRSRSQELMALTLSVPQSLVSHNSAAELYRLGIWRDVLDHITTPADQRAGRRRNVRIHSTNILDPCDFTKINNIPVTSASRTLIDLADTMNTFGLTRAIDKALEKQLINRSDLHATYLRVGKRRGRKRFLPFKNALSSYDIADLSESPLERRFRETITFLNLPEPTQQYEVNVQSQRFRLDFAYPNLMIAIELDGYRYHATRQQFDLDRKRDNILRIAGWETVRFTHTSTDSEIAATLRSTIQKRQFNNEYL